MIVVMSSKVHKIHVSCYVTLQDTHQALAQEFKRPTLSSWALQRTSYLYPSNYSNILSFFISWQVFNYIQGYTLSISNNQLLAFISKLYITSNVIYKPPAIIYKPIIICKGCYVTVTNPINKDLQIPLHTIHTKCSLLSQDTYAHNSNTHIKHIHILTNSCIFILTILTHILN